MTKNINVSVSDAEYDYLEHAKEEMDETWKGVLLRSAELELEQSFYQWKEDRG